MVKRECAIELQCRACNTVESAAGAVSFFISFGSLIPNSFWYGPISDLLSCV